MLTQQRLKELIQYDPVTGKFYRPTKSGAIIEAANLICNAVNNQGGNDGNA